MLEIWPGTRPCLFHLNRLILPVDSSSLSNTPRDRGIDIGNMWKNCHGCRLETVVKPPLTELRKYLQIICALFFCNRLKNHTKYLIWFGSGHKHATAPIPRYKGKYARERYYLTCFLALL